MRVGFLMLLLVVLPGCLEYGSPYLNQSMALQQQADAIKRRFKVGMPRGEVGQKLYDWGVKRRLIREPVEGEWNVYSYTYEATLRPEGWNAVFAAYPSEVATFEFDEEGLSAVWLDNWEYAELRKGESPFRSRDAVLKLHEKPELTDLPDQAEDIRRRDSRIELRVLPTGETIRGLEARENGR